MAARPLRPRQPTGVLRSEAALAAESACRALLVATEPGTTQGDSGVEGRACLASDGTSRMRWQCSLSVSVRVWCAMSEWSRSHVNHQSRVRRHARAGTRDESPTEETNSSASGPTPQDTQTQRARRLCVECARRASDETRRVCGCAISLRSTPCDMERQRPITHPGCFTGADFRTYH